MKHHAKRLSLPWVAALATLLFVLAAMAAAQKAAPKTPPKKEPPPKKSNRVHVEKWAKDAKLSRRRTKAEIDKDIEKGIKKPATYKIVEGVKANTNLEVPDVLETKKQGVVVTGGTLVHQNYGPNTKVTFLTIMPTVFDYTKPIDYEVSLEKGKGQFRVGTLAQPSSIKTGGQMIATAPKGTAYSLNVQGKKTTLIVAEGKVDIYLKSAPGAAVTVNPREKFAYTEGNPFPEQATPIAAADEAEIRQLLSLPTKQIHGYTGGQEIRRPDAENVVVTGVEVIDRHQNWQSSTQRTPANPRPNVAYRVGPTEFWTYDANVKRPNKIAGFVLDLISHDGKTIYASKPNQGLWRMDWNGANRRQLSKRPLSAWSLSPDGKRILATEGWKTVPLRGQRGEPIQGKTQLDPVQKRWVVLSSSGGGERNVYTSQTESPAKSFWVGRSGRLYLSLSGENKTIDADARPIKVIPFASDLSTGQQWLYGTRGQDVVFHRISDGQTFTHRNRATSGEGGLQRPMQVLLKEKTFTLPDGLVAEIENLETEPRPFNDATDVRYPDGSANWGDIIAYVDRNRVQLGLAAFADNLDLTRNTVSALRRIPQDANWNGGGYGEVQWLARDKVMFGGTFEKRMIVTLGVKQPSVVRAADRLPFPVLDMLAMSPTEFRSNFGNPNAEYKFEGSLHTDRFDYQTPELGTVQVSFAGNNLSIVDINTTGSRSDATWASILGINLQDGWTRPEPPDIEEAGVDYNRNYLKRIGDVDWQVSFTDSTARIRRIWASSNLGLSDVGWLPQWHLVLSGPSSLVFDGI